MTQGGTPTSLNLQPDQPVPCMDGPRLARALSMLDGPRSVAAMYPALSCGRAAAGPDGIRGSTSNQGLRALSRRRVEALGEPAVDWRAEVAGPPPLAVLGVEGASRTAARSSSGAGPRSPAVVSTASKASRLLPRPPGRECELAAEPVQFRLVPALPLLRDETLCLRHGRQTLPRPAGAEVRLGKQAQVERAPREGPEALERAKVGQDHLRRVLAVGRPQRPLEDAARGDVDGNALPTHSSTSSRLSRSASGRSRRRSRT